ADRIVITKPDLSTTDRRDRLRRIVGSLNPVADIVEASYGVVDPAWLLGGPADGAETVERRLISAAADARRHAGIRSFVLRPDRRIAWAEFGVWLSLLIHKHGSRIL